MERRENWRDLESVVDDQRESHWQEVRARNRQQEIDKQRREMIRSARLRREAEEAWRKAYAKQMHEWLQGELREDALDALDAARYWRRDMDAKGMVFSGLRGWFVRSVNSWTPSHRECPSDTDMRCYTVPAGSSAEALVLRPDATLGKGRASYTDGREPVWMKIFGVSVLQKATWEALEAPAIEVANMSELMEMRSAIAGFIVNCEVERP